MANFDERDLNSLLMLFLASGKLNPTYVLPALKELTPAEDRKGSISTLLDALNQHDGEAFAQLSEHLKSCRLCEAREFHLQMKQQTALVDEFELMLGDLPLDAPLDWKTTEQSLSSLISLSALARDRRYVSGKKEIAPVTATHVEQQYLSALENGLPQSAEWQEKLPLLLIHQLEADVKISNEQLATTLQTLSQKIEQSDHAHLELNNDDDDIDNNATEADVSLSRLVKQYQQATTLEEKQPLLDQLCSSQNIAVAKILNELVQEPWEEERAELILTCRFDQPPVTGWKGWSNWLVRCERQRQNELQRLEKILQHNAGELFLIWYSNQPNADSTIIQQVEHWCTQHDKRVNPDKFVERWSKIVPPLEWNALTGIVIEIVDRDEEPADVIFADSTDAPQVTTPTVTVPEVIEPEGPSLWGDHIQPFFAEYWYMFAGVVMVIAGSSLLAFYTWDKHWLVPYTIMPLLLGSFTAALARIATWIENKDEEFIGTAAILRGAAIGLLPINFMAVALLSNDPQVSNKPLVVPLMGLLYLTVFGYGLNRWCGAVYKPLAWLLGGTLLFINSLVMLAPLARTVVHTDADVLLFVIGVGFHLGFLLMAASVVYFSQKIMTRELAEKKQIPWFFGATLVVTFLQVFTWVHGFLRHLPQVATYAPMIILTGGLVLLVERRALQLRDQKERHGEESFVGFALILLGILMGATNPSIRIFSFLLAGGIWLVQAISRRQAIHDWIALTFIMLAGASVGLLEAFPKPWLPVLGMGIALAMGGGSYLAEQFKQHRLKISCIGMQVSVLILTTIVAVLAQWRYQTPPLYTGSCLLSIVALFGYRAWREDQLKWVHSAMAILALSLLYLGCVDMSNQTLHGNTMVFGLSVISILWLVINWYLSARVVREARSTVLWVYGALAVAGMVLRVVIERGTPGDADWYRQWMDYSGPLLMAAVLVFAAWYSRSLIPSVMSAIIVIILFPELKANFREEFESFGWGSGLGSSLSALGMIILCFPLQRSRFLKNLKDGDRFMGKVLFPLRRYDHSLFTLPILASVLFLIIKTDTWTLGQHLWKEIWNSINVSQKTSIAVAMTGVTWTLFAIYNRRHSFAPVATYFGCLWLLVGIWSGNDYLMEPPHWSYPLLITGVLLQVAYLCYVWVLQPRADWVEKILATPTRQVLKLTSMAVAVVCVVFLMSGKEIQPLIPLIVFVTGQLVWHALSTKNLIHGSLLFVLSWVCLLTYTAPGTGELIKRLSIENSLMPTLWMLLGIHVVYLLMEFKPDIHQRLRSLTLPFLSIASSLAMVLVIVAIGDAFHGFDITLQQITLLVSAAMLTARAHTSSAMVLPVLLLAYIQFNRVGLEELKGNEIEVISQRLKYLSEPLLLSGFAFVVALLGHAGRWLYRWCREVVSGSLGIKFLRSPHVIWLFAPAALFALMATALHTALPLYWKDPIQLWAPYLAALTFATVGISWWRQFCYQMGVLLLVIANIHTIRQFGGEYLREQGISEIQMICLGIAATLLIGTIIRYIVRQKPLTVFINQCSLALAGMVLALLAANYFVHPNLAAIPWQRFVVSGTMAYLAGLYFRRAARKPDAGEETYGDICEGLYHFGVTVAIWCGVLLIPAFRDPAVALCALGVPIIYFYLRAESGIKLGLDSARLYRNSAAVISFVVLFNYVFRVGFQMVLFPDEPVFQTDYYHFNAPLIILLSLVMLRLHGLGGTIWLAFYGGLALVTGTFFSLTWLPNLSPFTHAIHAAWVAVALSHFWTVVSHQRSPLRTAIQQMAVIDGQQWFTLRRWWGFCLLAATQVAVLWGLFDWHSNRLMVAPLLVGAASILIHQGVIRRSAIYFGLAGLQILLALHADFLVESYLEKEYVGWAIVGIWGTVLLVHQLLVGKIEIRGMGIMATLFASLTMAHVFYHRPYSSTGLWLVAAGGLLAALTPRVTRSAQSGEQRVMAGLLLLVPAWLAYFSQAPFTEHELDAVFNSWAVLVTTAVLFATGSLAAFFQMRLHTTYDQFDRSQPRLFDQTLSLMGSHGNLINTIILSLSFVVTVIVQLLHYGRVFEPRELALIMGLYAAFGFGWLFEGKLRRHMLPYILLQLSVLGFFAVMRRQLILTTDFWTPEYDVWASLVVSFALTGSKQIFDLQNREVRIPLIGTLFTLPIVALIWVLYNHLGTNVALLIVGLHSLMFTFMGKDDKESPYNIVAIAGFVSFVMLSFWSKLELKVIHAYTIPVGIGVLILLQMFRQQIKPDTRNRVRLVTLLTMIGSTGFYALIDDRYPLAFNLTMIAICLAAMGLGSFLRIRLYLVLGFTGLMIDIASLLFKVLRHMERSSRMTIIGSIVLLVGVGLVFGAIYYKTHRARINKQLDRLRAKSGEWE